MKKIQLLFFALLSASVLQGQDPCGISINKSKGLPSNAVYDMLQDTKGYVWLAHDAGLTRYDAAHFKTYSSALQTSVSGSDIHQDKMGTIWYQNFDGYVYFVKDDSLCGIEQEKPFGYFPFGIVDESVFVMQKNGIDMFDLNTGKRKKQIQIPIAQLAYTTQTTTHYYVLAGSLYQIDKSGTVIQVELPQELIKHLKIFNFQNRVFLLSEEHSIKTFYIIQNGNITKVFETVFEPHIQNLSVSKDIIWACTTNGVYPISENGKLLNNALPYFPSKNITCVMQDAVGNTWFGTANEGIHLVPDLDTRLIKLKEYKPNRTVVNADELLVATKNDQLLRVSLQNFDIHTLVSGATNHEINQLLYDKEKHRIFYTSQEFRITDMNGKAIASAPMAVKQAIKIDATNYAFAASGTVGLFRLKNKSATTIWDRQFDSSVINNGNITWAQLKMGVRGKSVAYNPKNATLYFATNTGLIALNHSGVSEVNTGSKNLFISKLATYRNQVLALSTKGVLYSIDSDNNFTSLQGIANHTTEAIRDIKVEQDYLFIFTNNGVGYIVLNEDKKTYRKIETGLYTDEINDVSVWKNKLILVTNNGLIIGETASLSPKKTAPFFDIINFRVNDKQYNYREKAILEYNENEVEISYAILDFACLQNGQGGDNDFPLYYTINNEKPKLCSPETRSLKLPSLASGNYTIVFRYKDSKTDLAIIRFHIGRPFWEELWFVGICLMVLMSAVFLYFKRQIKRINEKNRLLAEKVELEQNLNTSMLTSIKAQMNPHFFYNALNTIQSFIFSNEKENASAYLNKFSKLTRVILEMSEKESVTLAEEINAITLYLEIEKARFNDDLDYTISVDTTLETEVIKIPSMIVQPYVENAIKHGLMHKKGSKKLTIVFAVNTESLTISIVDNGVGRKMADELNRKKQNRHTPFAIKANQKRIDLLNKGNNKIGIEITDIELEDGKPGGTAVNIVLPLT